MIGQLPVLLTVSAAALTAYPQSAVLALRPGRAPGPDHCRHLSSRRAVVVAVAVLAVGLLLGLWPWWFGLMAAAVAGGAVMRLPVRRSNRERTNDRRAMAVHADLVAACLDSGMSVGAALLAVPTAAGRAGSAGSRDADDPLKLLDEVAALLMLGADPDTAWRSAQLNPDLASLAAAAKRSGTGGAVLADAVREHAVNLRASIAASAQRSAGRAGVAMTAPLGLCFLPAFLCLGLAPVVVGLLSTLHLF